MRIQPATPHDAEKLTALAFAAKRHWGYPDAWLEQWRDELTFTPAKIATHLIHQAVDSDTLLGVYGLTLQETDAELTDLWVLPSAMGRGLGRRLFTHAESTARTLGATRLHLASDPHAEPFYLHLGMRRFGTRDATMDHRPRVLPLLEKLL